MYEKRTFYLSESITVKDLLSLLTNVSDRFLIETTNQKEMIESLRKTIRRTSEHAFALFHEVNNRTQQGCYYAMGLMNVEGLGIISILELSTELEHRSPSLIPLNLKINGFVLNSTVPSWKSIFSDEEQKKVFDDLELLITSELAKKSVNIREIVSKSEWDLNKLSAGYFIQHFFYL